MYLSESPSGSVLSLAARCRWKWWRFGEPRGRSQPWVLGAPHGPGPPGPTHVAEVQTQQTGPGTGVRSHPAGSSPPRPPFRFRQTTPGPLERGFPSRQMPPFPLGLTPCVQAGGPLAGLQLPLLDPEVGAGTVQAGVAPQPREELQDGPRTRAWAPLPGPRGPRPTRLAAPGRVQLGGERASQGLGPGAGCRPRVAGGRGRGSLTEEASPEPLDAEGLMCTSVLLPAAEL